MDVDPVALKVLVPGSYSSAGAMAGTIPTPSSPPTMRTRPSESKVAVSRSRSIVIEPAGMRRLCPAQPAAAATTTIAAARRVLKRLASAPREGCWHGLGAALVSVATCSPALDLMPNTFRQTTFAPSGSMAAKSERTLAQ